MIFYSGSPELHVAQIWGSKLEAEIGSKANDTQHVYGGRPQTCFWTRDHNKQSILSCEICFWNNTITYIMSWLVCYIAGCWFKSQLDLCWQHAFSLGFFQLGDSDTQSGYFVFIMFCFAGKMQDFRNRFMVFIGNLRILHLNFNPEGGDLKVKAWSSTFLSFLAGIFIYLLYLPVASFGLNPV